MTTPDVWQQARAAIAGRDALLVTCGAGMGVDSGLPDFRGPQGFWNAYPMYKPLGINFYDAANPAHFREDPAFGWGFYGHRLDLYRHTKPHVGFDILRDWAAQTPTFVVTSNVDGQFQAAGFRCRVDLRGSRFHPLPAMHQQLWRWDLGQRRSCRC